MRISDWSSDVCSSDLGRDHAQTLEERAAAFRIDIDDILTGSQPALKEGEGTATASAAPKPLPSTAAISEPAVLSGEFSWPLKGSILTSFGPGVGGQRNEGIDRQARSEERRVGKEGVRQCKTRCSA